MESVVFYGVVRFSSIAFLDKIYIEKDNFVSEKKRSNWINIFDKILLKKYPIKMIPTPSIEEIKSIKGNENLSDNQAREIANSLRDLITITCQAYVNSKKSNENGKLQCISTIRSK